MLLETGYPFRLWDPGRNYTVPVMARNELLAEKLAAWWIFGLAKHYADIAHLGGVIYRAGKVDAPPPARKKGLGSWWRQSSRATSALAPSIGSVLKL